MSVLTAEHRRPGIAFADFVDALAAAMHAPGLLVSAGGGYRGEGLFCLAVRSPWPPKGNLGGLAVGEPFVASPDPL